MITMAPSHLVLDVDRRFKRVATLYDRVRLWSWPDWEKLGEFGARGRDVVFTPDGEGLAVGGCFISLGDSVVTPFAALDNCKFAYSQDGRQAVSLSLESLQLWQTRPAPVFLELLETLPFPRHFLPMTGLQLHEDILLVTCNDGVRLYSLD